MCPIRSCSCGVCATNVLHPYCLPTLNPPTLTLTTQHTDQRWMDACLCAEHGPVCVAAGVCSTVLRLGGAAVLKLCIRVRVSLPEAGAGLVCSLVCMFTICGAKASSMPCLSLCPLALAPTPPVCCCSATTGHSTPLHPNPCTGSRLALCVCPQVGCALCCYLTALYEGPLHVVSL